MKDAEVPEKCVPGWLSQLDMRYASSQEVCARFAALTCDMGGLDTLSYQQRSLAERCVWLELYLAKRERELAEGKPFDIGQWIQGNNSLLGLYKALGLSRVSRKTETLAQYAARVAAENQAGGREVA